MIETAFPVRADEPKWYVLFVRTNQEKKVADRLWNYEVEHYLPSYASLRQWKDRRVKLQIPLFPGYLFVRLPLRERMRALTVPNVICMVGSKDSPAEIREEEIAWIRQGIEHGSAEPHPYLQCGQRVRITQGAMAGMEGILVRRKNNTRFVVCLDSISRSFAVDIGADSIRPAAAVHDSRRLAQGVAASSSCQDTLSRAAHFGD